MVLLTKRLCLRHYVENDVEALIAALNDWAVAQWLVRPPYPYSRQDAESYCAFVAADHANGCPTLFAVALREGNGCIGSTGIMRNEEGGAEVGYWFARAFWGRGYATEALTALLEYTRATHLASRLMATVDPTNVASRRVVEKCGFVGTEKVIQAHPTRRGTFELQRYELQIG